MHLYHWNRVKALTSINASGDIVILASSLEQARRKASENFRAWLQVEIERQTRGEPLSNDDLSQIEFLVVRLEADLKEMPVVGKTEIYIWGSE